MTENEKNRVLEMHDAGMGYRAISRATGISISSIAYVCQTSSPEETEVCLQCGAKLSHMPHRKKKKFCSDKCRMLWWHAHQDRINKQAYYHHVCQQCGKEFISYGNDHRKYCSRKCYAEHRRGIAPISGRPEEVLFNQKPCRAAEE